MYRHIIHILIPDVCSIKSLPVLPLTLLKSIDDGFLRMQHVGYGHLHHYALLICFSFSRTSPTSSLATELVSYCGGALQFPESRLKELCLDLAGQRQVAEDDDSICVCLSNLCIHFSIISLRHLHCVQGVSKRSLFREVIPLLASNRSLQKLTALLLGKFIE